jgi:acyl-[acyl-carrier-protein]-phospholipid O-acyltransferase/long-chain-fatty-acid--[acyl-carrier-protein] ligase
VYFRRGPHQPHRQFAQVQARIGTNREARELPDHSCLSRRVWGSIFSFERGRFLFKLPKRVLEPMITVYIGRAMTSSSTTVQVRQAIQRLSVEAFENHKKTQWPIDIAFIRPAKRRWVGTLAVDAGGSRITFGTALARAIALSRSLIGSAPDAAERIGIMMPPGIDAMLAHFAVWLAGRVPVDIDTSDPTPTVRSIVASSHLSYIITTSAVVDSHGDVAPARPLRFDDLGNWIKATHRLGPEACCFLLPARLLARIFVHHDIRDVDRVATVLYSYPGDPVQSPRGAMLTHHNLFSNLESLRQVFHVTRRDCVLGMATFANSMSFTATLLLPALTGARVAYGAELLGTDRLGPFCCEKGITLIPASPNLLTYLLDEVKADDLSTLRCVAVGGAQLDQRVSERFSAKFGIEPLEGYGCPECAPIISLNIPDYGAGAHHQPGLPTRHGGPSAAGNLDSNHRSRNRRGSRPRN